MNTRIKKTLILPILLLGMASCSLFEGRETTGQYVDDTTITSKVKEAYLADDHIKSFQINVETMQGVVQLSGFVDTTASEQQAVSLAQNVNGVKRVKDNIIVRSH